MDHLPLASSSFDCWQSPSQCLNSELCVKLDTPANGSAHHLSSKPLSRSTSPPQRRPAPSPRPRPASARACAWRASRKIQHSPLSASGPRASPPTQPLSPSPSSPSSSSSSAPPQRPSLRRRRGGVQKLRRPRRRHGGTVAPRVWRERASRAPRARPERHHRRPAGQHVLRHAADAERGARRVEKGVRDGARGAPRVFEDVYRCRHRGEASVVPVNDILRPRQRRHCVWRRTAARQRLRDTGFEDNRSELRFVPMYGLGGEGECS